MVTERMGLHAPVARGMKRQTRKSTAREITNRGKDKTLTFNMTLAPGRRHNLDIVRRRYQQKRTFTPALLTPQKTRSKYFMRVVNDIIINYPRPNTAPPTRIYINTSHIRASHMGTGYLGSRVEKRLVHHGKIPVFLATNSVMRLLVHPDIVLVQIEAEKARGCRVTRSSGSTRSWTRRGGACCVPLLFPPPIGSECGHAGFVGRLGLYPSRCHFFVKCVFRSPSVRQCTSYAHIQAQQCPAGVVIQGKSTVQRGRRMHESVDARIIYTKYAFSVP